MKTERRQLFKPSNIPAVMLNVTGLWLGLGFIVSIIFAAQGDGDGVENFFAFYGFFCSSIGALVVNIAAWIERNPGAKLALGLGSMGVLAVSVLMTAIAMALSNEFSVFAGVVVFSSPIFLVFSAPAALGGIRLYNQWGAAKQADHLNALSDVIARKNGAITYQQAADHLGIALDEVDPLLRALIQQGRVTGERLPQFNRFYTTKAKRQQELLILGQIDTEGTVFIEDIGLKFDLPMPLVKEMLYALVERGRFTGYVNWDEGKLYSATAKNITDLCPNCGGKLSSAGKHVIQCDFCGVEVFVA